MSAAVWHAWYVVDGGAQRGGNKEESFHVRFLPFHVVSKSKDASMTKRDGNPEHNLRRNGGHDRGPKSTM